MDDRDSASVSTSLSAESYIPIPNPNAKYLAATQLIDIAGLPFGSIHDKITDGKFSISFSAPAEKRGPVPLGWATWSSPPFSETPNPDVLVFSTNSLTMTLSEPVRTFGFELEPASFTTFTYTADFYFGNELVGSISRNINGNGGARLMAFSTDFIDRVVVSGPDEFAIANLRLQEVIQSQNKTIALASALLSILVVTPFIR